MMLLSVGLLLISSSLVVLICSSKILDAGGLSMQVLHSHLLDEIAPGSLYTRLTVTKHYHSVAILVVDQKTSSIEVTHEGGGWVVVLDAVDEGGMSSGRRRRYPSKIGGVRFFQPAPAISVQVPNVQPFGLFMMAVPLVKDAIFEIAPIDLVQALRSFDGTEPERMRKGWIHFITAHVKNQPVAVILGRFI